MSYTLAATMVAAVEEGAHEVVNELPVPAHWFGIGALVTFIVLLAIAFAFRSVGTRHD